MLLDRRVYSGPVRFGSRVISSWEIRRFRTRSFTPMIGPSGVPFRALRKSCCRSMLFLLAVPALLRPEQCAFARKQFFAHVDIFVEWTTPGGDDLWNTSTFWAHDVTNQRSRLEQADVQRSLSSGSMFSHTSTTRVTASRITYALDSEGNCTQVPASAADIGSTACTGSVVRFLPRKLATSYQKRWEAKATDAYINTTYIDATVVSSAAGTSTAATCNPATSKHACELVDVQCQL